MIWGATNKKAHDREDTNAEKAICYSEAPVTQQQFHVQCELESSLALLKPSPTSR